MPRKHENFDWNKALRFSLPPVIRKRRSEYKKREKAREREDVEIRFGKRFHDDEFIMNQTAFYMKTMHTRSINELIDISLEDAAFNDWHSGSKRL